VGDNELQEGENPNNPQNLRFWDPENEVFEGFTDQCECGGFLKHVQNLNNHIDKPDSVNGGNICPRCQFKNKNDAKLCYNCGNEIIDKTSKADKPTSRFKDILDLSAIIKGLIALLTIVIVIKFLFKLDIRYFYLCIVGIFIGGLITGYFSKKGFKNGVVNGATVGAIFYFVNALFVIWFLFFPDQSWLDSHIIGPQTSSRLVILSIISSFILAIFGMVIGAIGGIIGNRFSKKSK